MLVEIKFPVQPTSNGSSRKRGSRHSGRNSEDPLARPTGYAVWGRGGQTSMRQSGSISVGEAQSQSKPRHTTIVIPAEASTSRQESDHDAGGETPYQGGLTHVSLWMPKELVDELPELRKHRDHFDTSSGRDQTGSTEDMQDIIPALTNPGRTQQQSHCREISPRAAANTYMRGKAADISSVHDEVGATLFPPPPLVLRSHQESTHCKGHVAAFGHALNLESPLPHDQASWAPKIDRGHASRDSDNTFILVLHRDQIGPCHHTQLEAQVANPEWGRYGSHRSRFD
ncbi:hypothetical protein CERSUDRAFT_122223 [Gelatoporia subvermispora B]|uniref:Uncharacterized protein n=1 Tax=Ceriporiopsis subvermispora (strain B) TaxID=914234 RepID=M2QSZ0_CERS8|nr:hypothetical protein CERSUDRAFT_122223 [Gelatoporia subvermispora B]